MEVLFWGADTSIYGTGKSFESKVEIEMESVTEDFTFLFVGQWTNNGLFNDRKDIGNLIKDFPVSVFQHGSKTKTSFDC